MLNLETNGHVRQNYSGQGQGQTQRCCCSDCRRLSQEADSSQRPTIVKQKEVVAEVAIREKKAFGSLYVPAGHQVD